MSTGAELVAPNAEATIKQPGWIKVRLQQLGFAMLCALFCYAIFAALAHWLLVEIRGELDHMPGMTLASCVSRLVEVGKLPPVVASFVPFITTVTKNSDAGVLFRVVGLAGEIACVLLSCLVPKRLLSPGSMSFAVLPALVYVVAVLSAFYTHSLPADPQFAYYLVLTFSQVQVMVFSCLLLSLRAHLSGNPMTSRRDLILFAFLFALFLTIVKHFDLSFGTFTRM